MTPSCMIPPAAFGYAALAASMPSKQAAAAEPASHDSASTGQECRRFRRPAPLSPCSRSFAGAWRSGERRRARRRRLNV